MPAARHTATASSISGRGGSHSATKPRKVKSRSITLAVAVRSGGCRTATPSRRRPSAARRSCSASAHVAIHIGGRPGPGASPDGPAKRQNFFGAPLTNARGPSGAARTSVIRLRNESNGRNGAGRRVPAPKGLGIHAGTHGRRHQRDLGGITPLERGLRGQDGDLEQLSEVGRRRDRSGLDRQRATAKRHETDGHRPQGQRPGLVAADHRRGAERLHSGGAGPGPPPGHALAPRARASVSVGSRPSGTLATITPMAKIDAANRS